MVEIMPLLRLRGVVVFPQMLMHMEVVETEQGVEAAMVRERRIFIVAEDYEVGTISEIKQINKLPDGKERVLVEGLKRGVIMGYRKEMEVEVAIHEDKWEASKELDALVRAVVHEFEEWVKLSRRIPTETFVAVTIMEDYGRLADLIASHLNLKMETKQEILSSLDVVERLEKLYGILAREIELLLLERQISNRVMTRLAKLQKDNYLREQLRAIQAELGEETAEVEMLRSRVTEGDYPEAVRAIISKELKRLEQMPAMASEGNVIRGYIGWLMDLPWGISSEDNIELTEATKILDSEHYGLEQVKQRILEFLAVRVLFFGVEKHRAATLKYSGSANAVPRAVTSNNIICLVGAPGVGKTSLASSIAKAMGRKFVRCSLGGVRDEAEIRGHRRTYVGAMPGRIIQGIKKAGTNNPVFLLDEIDKLGHDNYAGDPSAALLEVLDPAQNNSFNDHYIDTPFDLSKVLWIVTANNLNAIPKPLRDRMEIIFISSYTEQEKFEIAKRYLVDRQRAQNGLQPNQLRITPYALKIMITEYTREAGVRELERVIGKVCRKAARQIVEGNQGTREIKGQGTRDKGKGKSSKPLSHTPYPLSHTPYPLSHTPYPLSLTKKNLREYLGRPKYPKTRAEHEAQIGVSTGMAWTEVGGDILPTEAIVLKGTGKLLLTGKLGEVMQESAQAGLTYIRSRSDQIHLPANFYKENDIHIHVPEGAVPKDGPSAGITMATAMISALTKKKVRSDVAMTGEITLRGNVLPIGGLKEKVLTADDAKAYGLIDDVIFRDKLLGN